MQCPTCQQEMVKKDTKITDNGKTGDKYKEYKRTLYWCPLDDIWIGVEIPLIPPQHIA